MLNLLLFFEEWRNGHFWSYLFHGHFPFILKVNVIHVLAVLFYTALVVDNWMRVIE